MNTAERLSDLESQGKDHTNRLIGIEEAFRGLRDDVRSLADEMKVLIRAVTTQEAKPRYELHKIMPVVASAVIIFGAITGGIIYMSNSESTPATLENKLRLEFMKERLDNGWLTMPHNVSTFMKGINSNGNADR